MVQELFARFSESLSVWNVTRAAGLTSYVLLFLSIVAGMLQSFSQMPPSVRKIWNIGHQSFGWFGLLFGLVHGIVLTLDRKQGLEWKEIFVPFAASEHSLLIGIGIIALYAVVIVMVTSDWLKWIGRYVWRAIHYLSFPAYLLALVHSVLLGSDTQYRELTIMYAVTAGIVIMLFILRITQGIARKSASLVK
ncbi:MAG: ferric reductase-like transmembrane domain-containing protein [Anoxybacillus sp.]|nr:ferric reductase-like transmembrane domain-containing protein [Anoxybacillus sp.]MCL6587464.1 ferric reductase-like transmembrane domain-containing protein [Anoxybacillus sp.]